MSRVMQKYDLTTLINAGRKQINIYKSQGKYKEANRLTWKVVKLKMKLKTMKNEKANSLQLEKEVRQSV